MELELLKITNKLVFSAFHKITPLLLVAARILLNIYFLMLIRTMNCLENQRHFNLQVLMLLLSLKNNRHKVALYCNRKLSYMQGH